MAIIKADVEYGDYKGAYVDVTVTRSLGVGSILKINPSEAYLGIESGNIEVKAILPMHELYKYSEDVDSMAQEFARVLLDTIGSDYETEETTRLEHEPWIVYLYFNGEYSVLPLEEFIDHTMQY